MIWIGGSLRKGAAMTTLAASISAPVVGQPAMIQSRQAPIGLDSGVLEARGPGMEAQLIFATTVEVAEAAWVRLHFGDVVLGSADGLESFVVIRSLLDGAAQRLGARQLSEWGYTSAYFNGGAVAVELWAMPGMGPARLVIRDAVVGEAGGEPENVCGLTDDRLPSNDPRAARLMPIGCTTFMVMRGDCSNKFLTAGHCISPATQNAVVQFNVPFSTSTGQIQHPPPEYQYPVEPGSIQATTGGAVPGDDAATFQTFANATTGRPPREAQRGAYELATVAPPAMNQWLRINGYAARRNNQDPIPFEWNQTQKTGIGPYVEKAGLLLSYQVDTEGGNSGSPVILESTGEVIGIHTHGGCNVQMTGANRGTAIEHPGLQAWLANPLGTCIPYVAPNCLATVMASNDEGAMDGAVYFDAAVGAAPIDVWGLDLNISEASTLGGTFTVRAYTTPGGHGGVETDPGAWTLAALGVGIVEPEGNPSRMVFANPFRLDGRRVHGIALVISGAAHAYTIEPGPNRQYSTPHVALTLGAATDAPFSQPLIIGRVWNGAMCYDVGEAPCYANCDGSTVEPTLTVDDFTCFINEFASAQGLPHEQQVVHYANCDGSTGAPVLNVDDFTCFVNAFAAGCR